MKEVEKEGKERERKTRSSVMYTSRWRHISSEEHLRSGVQSTEEQRQGRGLRRLVKTGSNNVEIICIEERIAHKGNQIVQWKYTEKKGLNISLGVQLKAHLSSVFRGISWYYLP